MKEPSDLKFCEDELQCRRLKTRCQVQEDPVRATVDRHSMSRCLKQGETNPRWSPRGMGMHQKEKLLAVNEQWGCISVTGGIHLL